jgi:hypothetical protein
LDFTLAQLTATLQNIGVVMCLLTTYKATKILQLVSFIILPKEKYIKRKGNPKPNVMCGFGLTFLEV